MDKYLATTTGTLAILATLLLTSEGAWAGASASAPSKYAHANQVATTYPVQTKKSNFAITEYSSSSARNPSQRH
jgi:hypothetical protein